MLEAAKNGDDTEIERLLALGTAIDAGNKLGGRRYGHVEEEQSLKAEGAQ